ncbi:sulfite exporter TauE/SafE family protein [Henriciella barbarensis]|uniref:Probable membrane transporter protein n=1 Tax=Henriciella barbarensis TaxID=86342 RepID=A0A399QZG8_9PROT|nr:sulfite exporter TauE/SafE family protein [Henriciella barbarensis]RIJ23614.1 sulfite exporter TauE/SafE family protein [Henriciella barbarensis]
MSPLSAAIILIATLVTAFISGIFGMAGGLILMGVLTALLPVATAMIVHGAIQMVSNGWRAWLLRKQINWVIFARYAAGSVGAVLLLILLAWRPDKTIVFLLLGCTPLMVWVPRNIIDLDIQKRGQAEVAGFIVQALNTLAGVAGPLLDLFFVRTDMTRQAIVATKSATQVLAHLVKIAFWSLPILAAAGEIHIPPLWLFAFAIPLSMTGTWLGGLVLARMSDVDFKRWMRWLVTVIGVVYLARAAGFL